MTKRSAHGDAAHVRCRAHLISAASTRYRQEAPGTTCRPASATAHGRDHDAGDAPRPAQSPATTRPRRIDGRRAATSVTSAARRLRRRAGDSQPIGRSKSAPRDRTTEAIAWPYNRPAGRGNRIGRAQRVQAHRPQATSVTSFRQPYPSESSTRARWRRGRSSIDGTRVDLRRRLER